MKLAPVDPVPGVAKVLPVAVAGLEAPKLAVRELRAPDAEPPAPIAPFVGVVIPMMLE